MRTGRVGENICGKNCKCIRSFVGNLKGKINHLGNLGEDFGLD
jgi:hypothetical protein